MALSPGVRPAAAAGLVLAVLVATACTAAEPRTGPLPSPSPSTSQSASTPRPTETPPEPTGSASEPAAPRRTEPLALAVHPRRPPLDLGRRLARSLVRGEIRDWASLGATPAPLEVRRGAGAVAATQRDPDVVAAVRASRVGPTMQVLRVDGVDPLRSPRAYPLRVRTSQPPPQVTTITVTGDIMLGRRVGDLAAAAGDVGAPLRPLQDRLARADLTVGNLESTLSRAGAPRQGDDSFAAPPTVLDGLDDAGFDLLSLANNHTGDFGPSALRRTLRRIDASDIERVGAGRDGTAAWRPAVLEHGGIRFGFVAFNAIGETPRATRRTPGAAEIRMPPRTGPLDQRDLASFTGGIERLDRHVDVVIAMPHWGEQYTNQPVPAQRRVGRALLDAGADIVVGGHPHWVQGVQVHRDRLIVHSLGNFVFDMDFMRETMEGALLELVFWDDTLRGARFVPYAMDSTFTPRLVSGDHAEQILDLIWAASDPPFRS